MMLQEQFQKAKQAGYSDEEIIEYLKKKDPSFSEKTQKAQEAGYTPQEIVQHFNKPKEEKFGVSEYAKDIGKQYAQGTGIGALGTYGDILDLLGLQAKETLPGEKEKYNREFDILEKMQKGERPSTGELYELSEGDEVAPRYSRLPSSKDVEEFGTKTGLVTEPKTAAGRYAKRIGKLQGSTLATAGTAIKAPIVAGSAGQTLEELGAPPWAQAAAEMIFTLKFSPKDSARPVTSKSPEVQKTIKDLRAAGYSEQDITLAKNALEERKILKKYGTLTPEAENVINQGIKNSEKLFQEEIKKGLPGYAEGGIRYLEKQASNVYQTMEEWASTIPIKNSEPVKKAIQDSISYLEKYPLLKEQKDFIEFLKDGLTKTSNANTAEFFTGFYRNLGKAGNWGNPKQKEHILGIVKQGIKETFKESGPEAKKFGEYFEITNEAWKKWINAKELMENLEKAKTTNGIDFQKAVSILNDPDNYQLAAKVLGPQQSKNLETISKGAQTIESMLKQIPKSNKDIQSFKLLSSIGHLFLHKDVRPLGAYIGIEAAKRLATDILINPKKQNIMLKIITAAKNNSPQQAAILAQELIEEEKSNKNSLQATKAEG